MAIDKDFVIRNGIEVNEDLIYADPTLSRVGVGTTIPTKKLDVSGDVNVSASVSVGTTVFSTDGSYTGIITANNGYDIGVGGTFITASTDDKKIGIGSTNPVYTLDLYGPVSTGTTAAYIFGDVEVTGNIKATALQGQISAGGTVTFTNVTVDNNLIANNAEVYTKFTVEETGSDTFTFIAAGDPPGIGFTQNVNNPEIYVVRGQKYLFDLDSGGFPFYIKSQPTADLNNQYNAGVDNNGAQVGIVTFKVPFNAPNILYYQASNVSGMGGTIYVTQDYKSLINTGIATITTLDVEDGDFVNINVSGMATIANIRSTNFSVSAGIVTATKFVGVSTGSDMVSVHQKNDSVQYQLLFTESVGIGSNYQLTYVDTDGSHLTYNPSSRTLSSQVFAGTASQSDSVNVDERNDSTNYQVGFVTANGSGYQQIFIDTDNSHFTYNPSTHTLNVANFVGDLRGDVFASNGSSKILENGTDGTDATFTGQASNATNVNLRERNSTDATHFITFGTSQTGNQRINTDSGLTYNPADNQITSGSFVGDVLGTTSKSDSVNVDERNNNQTYQVGFITANGSAYQQIFIDTDNSHFTYNPSTQLLSAGFFSGNGASVTNLDGGNVTTGVIDEDRLPNASTTAQGVVELDNTYPPTSTSTTETATTNVSRRLYNEIVGVIPSGTAMLFYQASAPTGWTKVTSGINNKALRVVTGSTGGTVTGTKTFTSTFTSRSVPLLEHNHTATIANNGSHTHTGSTADAGEHNHDASTNTQGNHDHSYATNQGTGGGKGDGGADTGSRNATTNQAGSHSHTVTVDDAGEHNHTVSVESAGSHNHTITIDDEGTASASMDFAVSYLDVIVCTKDSY